MTFMTFDSLMTPAGKRVGIRKPVTPSVSLTAFKTLFNVLTRGFIALLVVMMVAMYPASSDAAKLKIKDITHIKGVRDNQLVGRGLVVGLPRTGDQSRGTLNTLFNLVRNTGGRLNNENDIRTTNAAEVIVTATVPPFAKEGDRIDVIVSSMADAKSLAGGTLIVTQLFAPNGEVVAVAQGPVSTGGVSVSSAGSSKSTSVTTSGRIPQGAIMERDIQTDIGDDFGFDLVLDRTDFTMTNRIAEAISRHLAPARAADGSTVRVHLPDRYVDDRVRFISLMENLEVDTIDEIAKVVVNERTGTIVIGNGVRLLPAAVAHGGITVTVKTTNEISQPSALSSGGQSIGVSNSEISIDEEKGSLIELNGGATLGDLVSALNAIGVTPNDLISILQALKASGSLEAVLEII